MYNVRFSACHLFGLLSIMLFCASPMWAQEAKAAPDKGRTLLTVLPFKTTPVIDGKLSATEWEAAAMAWGGISSQTKMLAKRRVDFRIGFDRDALYLAQSSELPPENMKDLEAGTAKVELLPPG